MSTYRFILGEAYNVLGYDPIYEPFPNICVPFVGDVSETANIFTRVNGAH